MRLRLVSPLLLAVTVVACAPGPTPSPVPSAVSTTAPQTSPPTSTPGPSPSIAGAATTWVGDPITVAEAIDHRDNHLDDTELAIEGWTWRPAIVIGCTPRLIDDRSPARVYCDDLLTWMSDAEPAPQGPDGFSPPPQPALQLLIRPDTYAQVPLPPQPGRVIVMGHFDDHRSADCPPDQVEACRRNFLVDAILNADAPALDRSMIDGRQIEPGTTSARTPADVVEGATGIPPGTDRVLVASPVPGSGIASYEPKASGVAALADAKAVWLIRYLARTNNQPVVKTVLVADRYDLSAGNVFAVTPTGEVVLQPGQIVSP